MSKEIRARVYSGETFISENVLYTNRIIRATHQTSMLAGVAQIELSNGTKTWVYVNRDKSKKYKAHSYKVVRYPSLTLIDLIPVR